MKRAIRMLFLMVGLMCTYSALATPVVAPSDGAPPPYCPPRQPCR